MVKFLKNKKVAVAIATALTVVVALPIIVSAAHIDQSITPGVGIAGKLTFQGSTTVGPIVAQSVASYNADRGSPVMTNNTTYIVQNGSGSGVEAMNASHTDIGMSSSPISSSTYPNLVPAAIARDGLVFIVNSSVTGIQNISKTQLDDIYEGVYYNWNQIKDPITNTYGPDLAIKPRARIIGSGTRAAWKDVTGGTFASPDVDPTVDTYVPGTRTTENMVIFHSGLARIDANVDVQARINSDTATGECAYVGMGFDTGANIRAINVMNTAGTAGVAPTGANIYSGAYPFARFLYLCTNSTFNPANKISDVNHYITWIKTLDGAGQQAVKDAGFLKLVPDQDVKIDSSNLINGQDLAQVGGRVGETGTSPHWIRADVKQDVSNVINGQDLAQVGGWVGTVILPVP